MIPEHSNAAILKELGERFKQQRAARNIDQASLAFESGVPQRTLSRLENGHATSFEAVIKVMRALDMLDRLDLMLPASDISPVQITKHKRSKPRRRARTSPRAAAKPDWPGFAQPVAFDDEGEA
jgi:transcriptional regulator with XRE-family HTH domain